MSTSAPAKNAKAAKRQPPDEQFWQRYSPHGEAPLSMAASVALHALVVVGMLMFAFYLASLFYKPQRTLPIEPVRLVGGGGGNPKGVEGGKGGVGPAATEDVGSGAPAEADLPTEDDAPPRPALLTPKETKVIADKYDDPSVRLIQRSDTGKRLARLEESVRSKLSRGLAGGGGGGPPKGDGGPGKDGGKGAGTGKGQGSGVGPGKATLNKREKRMLRWHMRFTANNGREYLDQLRGLGAILAFPITAGAEPQYKVVRDLRPGGQLLDEDLSKIERIYWIDDNPKSVDDILAALGARLGIRPAHIVAFMPEELEKKLFEMERRYVEKVLRQRFNEDRIDDTQFRVVRTPTGYRPELISVMVRRR